jgi:hypothetical protein
MLADAGGFGREVNARSPISKRATERLSPRAPANPLRRGWVRPSRPLQIRLLAWVVRVEGRREQCHAAFMSGQAFGWIVEAVNVVRRRVVGAALAHVQAVTMLSRRTVTVLLRLKPGEVAQVI